MAPLIGLVAIVASCCKHVLQAKHTLQYKVKSHPIDFNTPYCKACTEKWNKTSEISETQNEDADMMDVDEESDEDADMDTDPTDDPNADDSQLIAMLQGLTVKAKSEADPAFTHGPAATPEELKVRNEWFNECIESLRCGLSESSDTVGVMGKAIKEYEKKFGARFIDDVY